MKRALSLILCAVMLSVALISCTTLEKDPKTGDYDKGAIIPMYIGTQLFNFDPAVAYLNDSQAKILSLLYEGLTDIDENGKLVLTLIDKYEIHDGLNEFGEYEYKMIITLKNTRWSDGRELTANDVVYAWKRILDVDYDCEAAALLYDIKNARAIKLGDMTIDDLGLKAPETKKIEIEFETSIDYQQFLRNLSSPALVPLRGDIAKKNPDWAKKPSTIVTSGPFTIKRVTYNDYLRLERSSYYFLNKDKKEHLDKYVIPYRIEVDYSKSLEDILKTFNAGRIFYIDELPLEVRRKGTYDKYVTVTDQMSTHAYYLNLNNELLKDSRVRRALSLAIDREYVAKDIVVYAHPATGFIPYKVMDTKVGTSFREAGGDLLDTKANMEEAKALLKEAGVSGGELTVAYYKEDDVSAAIASYVKTVWEELGFTIKLRGLTGAENISDSSIYNDRFNMMYTVTQAQKGEFDVIAIDYQMLSDEAFSALAPFAAEFSGNGITLDPESDSYDIIGHITGYNSEEYNNIIEQAFAEKNLAERTPYLHQAEELLMEDMPIIPIIFNQDAYIYSNVISGIKTNYYGFNSFNRVKMDNYMAYKKIFDTTDAAETADIVQ